MAVYEIRKKNWCVVEKQNLKIILELYIFSVLTFLQPNTHYTRSAKFLATPILTWFSNKNEQNWNLLQQLITKLHANQFIYHLFNMASFIFNNLLQSPLKCIARGTQNFLGDQGLFPL